MACSGIEALIWMCEFNAEINRFPKTFYCPLLMAFDIYHTAINIDGDGFELALSQKLSEEIEIDSDVSIRSLNIWVVL